MINTKRMAVPPLCVTRGERMNSGSGTLERENTGRVLEGNGTIVRGASYVELGQGRIKIETT